MRLSSILAILLEGKTELLRCHFPEPSFCLARIMLTLFPLGWLGSVGPGECLLPLALVQGDAVAVGVRDDNHSAGGKFMRPHQDWKVLCFGCGQGAVEILDLERGRSAF